MDHFDLPEGVLVTGDKTYNNYVLEDLMSEAGRELRSLCKKNTKRPFPAWMSYLFSCYHKVIETTSSLIEKLLSKYIHAVTAHVLNSRSLCSS